MKISVCMAVYNGENYLHHQIFSILNQLKSSDELIVVDDCSQDDSVKLIEAFNDSRIHIFKNHHNLGVIKSFERCLGESNGDLIFLSDQDDIWLPGKVERFRKIFIAKPEFTLISSDAQIIDGEGNLISESFFSTRGDFTANPLLNLIQNKHLGCTLAFQRKMLKFYLPFPSDTPMHDIWIGLVNGIYGKAYFLDESLIQYRRHGKNVTGMKHAELTQMIRWRVIFIKNLIKLILKNRFITWH
jgi:glycosyltransferase involved in cell wall biosynthesis